MRKTDIQTRNWIIVVAIVFIAGLASGYLTAPKPTVIEKEVLVPYEVEKIVEVEVPVEKIIEVPVEVIKEVERIVEIECDITVEEWIVEVAYPFTNYMGEWFSEMADVVDDVAKERLTPRTAAYYLNDLKWELFDELQNYIDYPVPEGVVKIHSYTTRAIAKYVGAVQGLEDACIIFAEAEVCGIDAFEAIIEEATDLMESGAGDVRTATALMEAYKD